MRPIKSLSDRLKDQAEAKERLAERLRKIALRNDKAKQVSAKGKSTKKKLLEPAQVAPEAVQRVRRSWAQVSAGSASIEYQSRTSGEEVHPQPWTTGLVNALLKTGDEGGISLWLVWPAKLSSVALLHPLANMERVFAKDLRGIRTLLWPGTHTSKATLQSVLASRTQLSALFRSLWGSGPGGGTELLVNTESKAFLGALDGLNYVHFEHPELPNPSLAELAPSFIFDPSKMEWTNTVVSPLERTLSKIARLAHRRMVREKLGSEWGAPNMAPGALMVLHHTAKKAAWKAALASTALQGVGRPEVLLIDATDAAARTNYSAVKQIPEFLRCSRECGFDDIGTVVVTDDPKTFFVLRAQLHGMKMAASTNIWAAEADDSLLSARPVSACWKPTLRSNANFSVGIVDRDASQLALVFQRLAATVGDEENHACRAMMKACLYILRLSNMPSGYIDLTAVSAESGGSDFNSQLNAWVPVSLALRDALASGELNAMRAEVEKAIRRAEQLIDDWNDATPMASRLLAEVRKHALASKQGISIVLPNNKYVLLAHRFLQRNLSEEWAVVEPRLEWHTLSSVAKTLSNDRKGKHFVFVGINSDVLRILVTHPDIPHGTAVLVAYRQAESTLTTLSGLKEVEAFKAYRGRIGLLAQELERRLKEVPNPISIGKLAELSMTFSFDGTSEQGSGGEHTYYKFGLEDGGSTYASGWVYRYVPDEDPPFRRAGASMIRPGDLIFDMSDDLRAKVESALQLNGDGASSIVDPLRMLLKLYHNDIQTRCSLMFTATKRSALAREIHARMVEIDPRAEDCKPGRVYYWLDLQSEGDTRPHASKDVKFFKTFCKALQFNDDDAARHWDLICKTRRLNQHLGRELVSRYAEIMFQPEGATTYRKVPQVVIKRLQQEALHCVYRVDSVAPPPGASV